MSDFIESIFDNCKPNFRLWQKKNISTTVSEDLIIYQGLMFKASKNNENLQERQFVLTADKLFYKKSIKDEKIRGELETSFVRCDYFIEQNGSERRFQIRFIKNMKYCEVFVKNEADFLKWQEQLSKVFIQTDFHQKFEAIKMIGKGSFARVYLIENMITKKQYAVKAFSKDNLLSQSKGKSMVMNEITIMKSIDHPNILKLEEIHETKNSIYLVLELLQGGELFSHISKKKNLSIAEIQHIMKNMLEALVYLDKKRIIHRDLKPENMILAQKGDLIKTSLKIIDFGLSTNCDVSEYLYKKCGTPGYVAPEILNLQSDEMASFSPKCDIFSAGIILYILLTGTAPFNGTGFQEIIRQNKACCIQFNDPKLKKYPNAIDLLKNMLNTDPTKRISASETLTHPFFLNLDKLILKHPEKDQLNLEKDFKLIQEKNKEILHDKIEDDSFVVQEIGVINGLVVTVDNSNSNGGILSFKNVQRNQQIPRSKGKRESIYKSIYPLITNEKE